MRSRMPLLLFGLSCLAAACAHRWEPFTSSSLDFNDHKIHRITVKGAEAATLVGRITALAEKRDVSLVFSSCKGNTCECSFKRKVTVVSRTKGGGGGSFYKGSGYVFFAIDTQNFRISSLVFSRITQNGDDAVVTMIGVPVINESVISCPPALLKERRCRPIDINLPEAISLGADISGHTEAQIISGIFAELWQMPPTRKVVGAEE